MNYKKEAAKFMADVRKTHRPPNENVQRFSKGEFMTLMNIWEHGGAVTGSELAEKGEISTARITAIIGSLEKKGYVVRETDVGDRRRIYIQLTENGKKQANDLYQEALENTIDFMKYLGEEDTRNLLRIVEKSKEYFLKIKELEKREKQETGKRKRREKNNYL